eukprot:gene9416-biopygen7547
MPKSKSSKHSIRRSTRPSTAVTTASSWPSGTIEANMEASTTEPAFAVMPGPAVPGPSSSASTASAEHPGAVASNALNPIELGQIVQTAIEGSLATIVRELMTANKPPQTDVPASTPQPVSLETSHLPSSSAPPMPATHTINAFSPEISSSLVRQIQSGEFFELSKLVPENVHKVSPPALQKFSICMGDDNDLKLVKGTAAKPITRIEEWTDAFIVYSKILASKFPARGVELFSYLETIRYAAFHFHHLGWLLYVRKFRAKAANDRTIDWGRIDQQLWLMTFTAGPQDERIFNKGPFSSKSLAATRDDVCRKFNTERFCNEATCRFKHVCNRPGCGGKHVGNRCTLNPGSGQRS